jgi:hypothetical protein
MKKCYFDVKNTILAKLRRILIEELKLKVVNNI